LFIYFAICFSRFKLESDKTEVVNDLKQGGTMENVEYGQFKTAETNSKIDKQTKITDKQSRRRPRIKRLPVPDT
jgi:hypothetical protein